MAPAKLYYYSATGRANQIRFALAAASIEFEDVFPDCGFPPPEEQRLKWRSLGGNTTNNIPMLEMPDGKVYTQSSAVIRAVARMGNLLPNTEDGLYLTDKLIADAEDLRSESYGAFRAWGASQEKYEKFINETIPLHFGNLERQLIENGGDFFVIKDRLTIADVALYDAVVNFSSNRVDPSKDCFESAPQLRAWVKRVESSPGIASYLASDQFANVQMKFDHNL
jgi:glutathione S-transferase